MTKRVIIWAVLGLTAAALLYRSLYGVGQIEYKDELLNAAATIWGRTEHWLSQSGSKTYPERFPPVDTGDFYGGSWPKNPYTGLPMTLGSQIGQFTYYQIESAPGSDFPDGYSNLAIVCFARIRGPFAVMRAEMIPGDAMIWTAAGYTPEEFRQKLASMFPGATVRMDDGSQPDTHISQ